MEKTSRGNRLHIGLYGRTNVGKSSIINKITKQDVSIVSIEKGTTTDVVYKPMELLPVGPVVFMDTAGLNDGTELGHIRAQKTLQTLDKADIIIIVSDYNGWANEEINIANNATKNSDQKLIAVITKNDIQKITPQKLKLIKKYTSNIIYTELDDTELADKFKKTLIEILPKDFYENKTITGNLVNEKDIVILVTPIDKEAPKGRLILPQVQVLRELLDKNAQTVVVKESELEDILKNLKTQPKLVITDSQVFEKVSKTVPSSISLTSFSILLANFKGDIKAFVEGAKALSKLKNQDKILFLESCTHHAIDDDIARVKIPKLLEKTTGKIFDYTYHSGCYLPKTDLGEFSLVIHCGACMTNSKEVLSRIQKFQELNIPITNYGVIIAHCLGILDRAIKPIIKTKP